MAVLKKAGLAVFIIANVLVLARAVSQEPVLTPDSQSYIESHFMHPPAYPLLLAAFRKAFGDGYLRAVVVFQGLFIMACAAFTGFVFKRLYQLGWPGFLLAWGVFCVPLVQRGGTYIGESLCAFIVGTEPLTYGLLLLAAAFAARYFFSRAHKDLWTFFLLASLAAAVRPQFFSLYAAGGALIALEAGRSIRAAARSALVLGGLFLLSLFAESGYHYLGHGVFGHTPLSGLHLATHRLYLSGPTDAAIFTNPRQKRFFELIQEEMASRGLLASQKVDEGLEPAAISYGALYISIKHGAIPRAYRRLVEPQKPVKDIAEWPWFSPRELLDANGLCFSLGWRLLLAHPWKNLEIARREFFRGHFFNLYILALFIGALAAMGFLAIKTRSPVYSSLFFISMLHELNCVWILGVEVLRFRYVYPTLALLCACVVVFFARAARSLGQERPSPD